MSGSKFLIDWNIAYNKAMSDQDGDHPFVTSMREIPVPETKRLLIEGIAAQLYTFDLALTGASRNATWHLISRSLANVYRKEASAIINLNAGGDTSLEIGDRVEVIEAVDIRNPPDRVTLRVGLKGTIENFQDGFVAVDFDRISIWLKPSSIRKIEP